MDKNALVRSWKDPLYRAQAGGLGSDEPTDHPSGIVELSDAALMGIDGAVVGQITDAFSCWPSCDATIGGTCRVYTAGCCGGGGGCNCSPV